MKPICYNCYVNRGYKLEPDCEKCDQLDWIEQKITACRKAVEGVLDLISQTKKTVDEAAIFLKDTLNQTNPQEEKEDG